MEPSGRNPWQSLANGTASKTAQTSENRCRWLPTVAAEMVRRGSTVRVRQRASVKCLQIGTLVLSVRRNPRTQNGHISGTRDALRRLATPSDTIFIERTGPGVRIKPC